MNKDESIEINPDAPVRRSVIWLHGLGADGSDFVPIVPELQLPKALGVRFIFPHAPVMPVTVNNGYPMRAWFDIYELAMQAKIDEKGIASSVSALERMIAHEESHGIPSTHIILAGFSQGAVIALQTGLCYEKPLGGICALSGYLPLADKVLKNSSKANKNIPIFIAHGTEDTLVPFALGKATSSVLKEAGYPVNWNHYAMTHSVCAEEIRDIGEWIRRVSE